MTRRAVMKTIEKQYPGSRNLPKITAAMMESIFDAYDAALFGGRIRRHLKETHSTITFKPNARLTAAAGRCGKAGCHYMMETSTKIFQSLDVSDAKKQRTAGIECTSRLECMLITFEHELIHLLFVTGLASPQDNHGHYFKQAAQTMFAHTSIRHDLLIDERQEKIGKIDLAKTKADFRVGQLVTFGKPVKSGEITKLNPKNAMVLVKDSLQPYAPHKTYNVPYPIIHPVTSL